MSARISGVKNFESQNISFVRGFPFSQVQSASEKGAIFAGAASVATVVEDAASFVKPVGLKDAVAAGAGDTEAFAVAAGAGGAVLEFFSSASNSSMRFRMASSSLAIAAGTC